MNTPDPLVEELRSLLATNVALSMAVTLLVRRLPDPHAFVREFDEDATRATQGLEPGMSEKFEAATRVLSAQIRAQLR